MEYKYHSASTADLRVPPVREEPPSQPAYGRDTERQENGSLTELTHADRIATMGRLAASIPHEVNQPITAMVTNAEAALRLLDCQAPNLDDVRRVLASIVQDGNRACNVIGRMRALIKKTPLLRDRLDINEAIREVIEVSHGEAVKNGVSAKLELADGLPLVQGDRVHLQQVILNLIINAVDAMSSVNEGPRELLISSSKAESDVLVMVRDSGPAVAPGALERAFDAFHTTKPSGLGLGLSICREIIEAHGGRLWASPNKTRGATFQFIVGGWTVKSSPAESGSKFRAAATP
jgi:C4-dicarboxylate-specific signal transduction histidine kinase